jgi:hypothetical protein
MLPSPSTSEDRNDGNSSSDDGDDEILVPRLGHISSRCTYSPSPRIAKTSDSTPKASGLAPQVDDKTIPISPLVLNETAAVTKAATTVKVDGIDSVHIRSNVFFSPLSPEFTPKWTQPPPPPPSKTPNLIEFPSPDSGSSHGTPADDFADDDKDIQWSLNHDGQLVDNAGAQWELAPEIVRLQAGSTAMTPTKSRTNILPTARPWSPSPLRHEQRPDSVSTATPGPRDHYGEQSMGGVGIGGMAMMTAPAMTREDANRKRYCAGELGEPDDSFPFTAFSTWRQKKLIDTVPAPPLGGLGASHRRHRSGSDGSASSQGSVVSMSYLPSNGVFVHGIGRNGTPPAFDSPRAAFEQFQAVHSRRSSLGSSSSSPSAIANGTANASMAFSNALGGNGMGGVPFGPPAPPMQPGGFLPQNAMMPQTSQAMALDNPLAALYAIANQAAINPELGQAVMRLAGLSVGNGPVPPMGPSPHNRKLGLYKTELCRSWEEKGSCRYGAVRHPHSHLAGNLTASHRNASSLTVARSCVPCRVTRSTGALRRVAAASDLMSDAGPRSAAPSRPTALVRMASVRLLSRSRPCRR